jgi:hypothetical protein
MGLFSRLFGEPGDDDMTEIDWAITRNEVRGDADAIPQSWYDARDRGIATFDEMED